MFQAGGRSLCKYLPNVIAGELNSIKQSLLLTSELSLVQIPCRTTYILRRKHPVSLVKKYVDQTTWVPRKRRNKVYELEKLTEVIPEGNINVILKQLIPGLGEKGDLVSVKRSYAYNKLLLPGLAEYATPEAVEKANEKAKDPIAAVDEERFSSLHVHRTINMLKRLIIAVEMNQENNWVLEPWHIRASLRKAGVHMRSEDSIEMPKEKIQGPDLNIQGKEFLVTITINKKEKAQVRCRLHHWHPDIMKRIQVAPLYWTQPAEPLFKEQAEILASMPLPEVPEDAVVNS